MHLNKYIYIYIYITLYIYNLSIPFNSFFTSFIYNQGWIQDFKLAGVGRVKSGWIGPPKKKKKKIEEMAGWTIFNLG